MRPTDDGMSSTTIRRSPAPRRQAARTRRHAPARPPTRHGTGTGTKPGSVRAIRRRGQAATPGLRPAHAPRLDPVPHRTVPGRVQHHPRIQARPLTGGAMRAVRRTPRTKTKKGDKEKEKEKKSRRGKHDTTPSHQPSEKKKDRTPTPRNTRDGHHTTTETTPQNSITSRGGTVFPCKKPGFGGA